MRPHAAPRNATPRSAAPRDAAPPHSAPQDAVPQDSVPRPGAEYASRLNVRSATRAGAMAPRVPGRLSRRGLLGGLVGAGALAGLGGVGLLGAAPPAVARTGAPRASGIVKPLPDDAFVVHGTNAESRWPALGAAGFHTPNELFFVRNHTTTPILDAGAWRLTVWGSGLRGGPVEFSLADLLRLPAVERTVVLECAGNGRDFFAAQQGQEVSGTPWRLGAVGAARWRGARLADVLDRAGIDSRAVDVQPRGLDDVHVDDGVSLGHVRRPLPVAKAMEDVLLAYAMNDEPLPYDHGYPARVLVPSWVGIASVKWVGDIEVSDRPLRSPWNTSSYRLFGPSYPEEGSAPLARQTVKSAFELPAGGALPAGRRHRITGRSWSGRGAVRSVEISTDGGRSWRPVELGDQPRRDSWVRWTTDWTPEQPGEALLMARATDTSGRTQPIRTTYNEQGYLFDARVRHPVTVTSW